MAILTLRSKVEVRTSIIDTQEMGKVIMSVHSEERTPLAINVNGVYTKFNTGDTIKSFSFTVPNDQANMLGQVPIPANTNLIDSRNIQLTLGVFATLGQYNDFGLTANDWEVYVQPD